MSDPSGKGYLDRSGLFVACKMVALVQCDIPLTIDNARVECKAPNFGPETAPGAPTAAGGVQPGTKLPVKMALNFLVKPEEKRKYDALFDQLQPEDDKISGDKVSTLNVCLYKSEKLRDENIPALLGLRCILVAHVSNVSIFCRD